VTVGTWRIRPLIFNLPLLAIHLLTPSCFSSAAFGPLPLALPPMPAPPSTDKKQKSTRKVRPALRPSGGSGVGGLVAAGAAAPATGGPGTTGSPTMLALLEGLDKELHGKSDGKKLNNLPAGGTSQPLKTPNMAADGARLIVSPPAEDGGSGPPSLPVATSHGSTEVVPAVAADDGSENENGGSNEAGVGGNDLIPSAAGGNGGGGGGGGKHQIDVQPAHTRTEKIEARKNNPEFTFDPGTAGAKKEQPTGKKRDAAAASERKEGNLATPAKRTR